MGQKYGIAITPLEGRSLEQALGDLYGEPVRLEPADERVDEVLRGAEPRAIAYEGFAWLFDDDLAAEMALSEHPRDERPATYILAESTSDTYAWSYHEKGRVARTFSQIQGEPDREASVEGSPLPFERDSVMRLYPADEFERAWRIWTTNAAEEDAEEADEVVANVGIEMTDDLIGYVAGFGAGPDAGDWYETLMDEKVQKVVKVNQPPPRRSLWQRLFGG